MSEPAIVALSFHDAQQITERIRLKVGSIQDSIEGLAALVRRAKDGEADKVLGFPSWTAYIVDVIGSDPLDLTRAERKKLVGFLATEGVSTRAIASVAGVDHTTVVRDIRDESTGAERTSRPATVTSLDGRERPSTQPQRTTVSYEVDTETGEVVPPEPRQPYRKPLTDGFRDATLDLAKLIARIENLAGDDRLARNKNEVARYANDLIRARDALQRVIDRMS